MGAAKDILAKAPEELSEADIIYDWNEVDRPGPLFRQKFTFFDETLRDGIQSPSVTDPSVEEKIRIINLLAEIGIDHVNIGLPGAGPRAVGDVVTLGREIRDRRLKIKPACAARTHRDDILPVIDASQKLGIEIEIMAFIGSSPIRGYAEGWDVDRMLKLSAEAIDLGTKAGLPVTYVTEDTTRSRPEVLARLFRNAIEHGAKRLCLCDTVGHVTPDGIRNLIHFTRDFIAGTGEKIGIDWHGHNDRGIGVSNAIYALEYGADRVHGTVLGLGERVGNAALDQILVNLKLLGHLPDRDLTKLIELSQTVARACEVTIPVNYPVLGGDAFRTATGVHAAAIIKAERKGHAFLADRIYSGVPAGLFGREQQIEVGHMSGESNVVHWLRRHGIDPAPDLVKAVLGAAKKKNHVLTQAEIDSVIDQYRREAPEMTGPAYASTATDTTR
ncbi:MAG TPA: LeuA family protein [Polyangia bacterium]|jgi:2-isopropylmalate synthase|nr:LeuA family protein [Polyangia bacterium]